MRMRVGAHRHTCVRGIVRPWLPERARPHGVCECMRVVCWAWNANSLFLPGKVWTRVCGVTRFQKSENMKICLCDTSLDQSTHFKPHPRPHIHESPAQSLFQILGPSALSSGSSAHCLSGVLGGARQGQAHRSTWHSPWQARLWNGNRTVLLGRPDPDLRLSSPPGPISRMEERQRPQVSAKPPHQPCQQSSQMPGGCLGLCTNRNPGIPPRNLHRLSGQWGGVAVHTVGSIWSRVGTREGPGGMPTAAQK